MTTEVETTTPDILSALQHACASHVGMRREENQDSFGLVSGSDYRLYIVADGMGGVRGGAIASSLAVKTVEGELSHAPVVAAADVLSAIKSANKSILEAGLADPAIAGMGTTFVALFFSGTSLHVLNVGDSRAYRIRNRKIEQLTEDHTLVRELVRQGAITEDQAENHPVSHMLTRSLGPAPDIEVDCILSKDGPVRGDRYLLCSDGLYNMLTESQILQTVCSNPSDVAVESLVDQANKNGGTDNITVFLVEVGQHFPVGIEDIQVVADEEPELPHTNTEAVHAAEQTVHSDTNLSNGTKPQQETKDNDQFEGSIQDEIEHFEYQEDSESGPETAQQPQSSSAGSARSSANERQPLVAPLVILLAGIGGGLVTYGLLNIGARDGAVVQMEHAEGVRLLSPSEPRIAVVNPSAAAVDNTQAAALQLPLLTTILVGEDSQQLPQSQPSLAIPNSNNVAPSDLSGITKRIDQLKVNLGEYERKLAEFEKPLSGDLGNILKTASQRREQLKIQDTAVREKLDQATGGLTVWYGRRKRLETTDLSNLASEVAVSSENVFKRQKEFTDASWAYMQKAEALNFKPRDTELQAQAQALQQERERRGRELASAVRAAIEEAVADVEHKISELTLERDRIDQELAGLDKDVDFVKVVTGSNSEAKRQLRALLQREREIAASELADLQKIAQ